MFCAKFQCQMRRDSGGKVRYSCWLSGIQSLVWEPTVQRCVLSVLFHPGGHTEEWRSSVNELRSRMTDLASQGCPKALARIPLPRVPRFSKSCISETHKISVFENTWRPLCLGARHQLRVTSILKPHSWDLTPAGPREAPLHKSCLPSSKQQMTVLEDSSGWKPCWCRLCW